MNGHIVKIISNVLGVLRLIQTDRATHDANPPIDTNTEVDCLTDQISNSMFFLWRKSRGQSHSCPFNLLDINKARVLVFVACKRPCLFGYSTKDFFEVERAGNAASGFVQYLQSLIMFLQLPIELL